jgi:hypothetical protein
MHVLLCKHLEHTGSCKLKREMLASKKVDAGSRECPAVTRTVAPMGISSINYALMLEMPCSDHWNPEPPHSGSCGVRMTRDPLGSVEYRNRSDDIG